MKQPDFIIIPTQLLGDDSLQPLDKVIFGYIYWMTKLALMKCVASNNTLAELAQGSQRGVANSLNRLEKRGYISRIYQDESNRVRVEIICRLAFSAPAAPIPAENEPTLHQMMTPLHETMKHVTSNDEQNKNELIRAFNKTNNTLTNVNGLQQPKTYGKPEINELFDYWQQQVGYRIEARIKQNRMAASNLLKKHGMEKLKQLIHGAALVQDDRYGPNISDFTKLQSNLSDLIVWGKKRRGSEVVVIS